MKKKTENITADQLLSGDIYIEYSVQFGYLTIDGIVKDPQLVMDRYRVSDIDIDDSGTQRMFKVSLRKLRKNGTEVNSTQRRHFHSKREVTIEQKGK